MTPSTTDDTDGKPLGVAEAKRRFSELIDRVAAGERFVVSRRGRPVLVLIRAGEESLQTPAPSPRGLAAVAGALADWDDLDDVVDEIYSSRRRARDRAVPELD